MESFAKAGPSADGFLPSPLVLRRENEAGHWWFCIEKMLFLVQSEPIGASVFQIYVIF